MTQQELIPHLFRTEFGKITAVLSRHFGIDYLQFAEDIASDTFLSALETWPYNSLPENPTAWLYAVAKNKAINHLKRDHLFREKIAPILGQSSPGSIEIDLSEENSFESQVQMLFAICHPSLSKEAQICLALRILCGFGIEEIASAFLTSKETINKRLLRGKEKLRANQVLIEFPSANALKDRLDPVIRTLYLLYNEGYYSESRDAVLREDLCLEAMRLTLQLIEKEQTNLPEANALLSLMCFHSSRFEARKNQLGEMVLYPDQDEARWNRELISKGAYYLQKSSVGDTVSKYHLEAAIGYWHTVKQDSMEKWGNILSLYDQLLLLEYSPIAALNRMVAVSKVFGKERAIVETEKLAFTANPYYFALLGDFYSRIDSGRAKENFQKAYSLAKTKTDQQILLRRMNETPYPHS